MSYSSKDGTFPLTLEECEVIEILCNEKISDMESDLNNKDPHKYISIKELFSKFNAMIKLMQSKEETDYKKEFKKLKDFRGSVNKSYE